MKQRNITCRMHPKMRGSPDILLPKSKTAVFLHGCFWHACPKCYKEPKTN
ncbi:very short patch repair endonuclease, partial [Candidatus Micrarchaeota archaeon CG11_big_fil_rev_8_21_14_0_20_47_5]